jgi:hypothetical protein
MILREPVGTSTANLSGASAEAGEREMALNQAMAGGGRTSALELPTLRAPKLAKDFQARLDELDEAIHQRGVAVDRDKLLELGKEQFTRLLSLDRAARELQRITRPSTDLGVWSSVQFSFQQAGAWITSVPRRRTAEVNSGSGLDREEAGRLGSFGDLWKISGSQPTVSAIYQFHDQLISLIFGQSLLERLNDDGRARSYSFANGSETKAALFRQWLAVLDHPHFTVKLTDPLWHIVSFWAGERTPAPTDLAQVFLGVRAPSASQLLLCEAMWGGFLLGHSGWSLWDYVGRHARQAVDVKLLEQWRQALGARFPAVAGFHAGLRTCSTDT